MKNTRKTDRDLLYESVISLRNLSEAQQFFSDLLTVGEIKEIASRWKVARMISKRVPYSRIILETGLSSRTVARVARCVRRGAGGYRLMLRRTSKRG